MMIPFNPFRPLCEINSERNQNKLVGPPAMPTVSPNPLSPEKGYKTLTVPSVNSCDVPSPGVNALSFDKTAQRSGASPPSLKESREGDAERRRRAVLSVLPKLSTGETQSRSFNDGVYTQYPKDSEFVDPVLGLSGTPGTARRLCSEPPARNSFGDGIDFNERESSITGATATKTDYDKVGKMSTVNPKEKINEERTLTTQETSYPKPTSAPNYQRAEQNHLNETRQKDDIAEQNRIYDVRNALPRSVSFSGFSKISIEGSISVERGLTAAPPFAFYSEKDQPPSSRLCSSSPSFCRSYSPSLSTSSVLSSISELDGNSEDDEEYTQSPKECRAGGSEHRRRAVLGVPLKPSPEPTNSEYFGEWG
jgi:hypothetical protein